MPSTMSSHGQGSEEKMNSNTPRVTVAIPVYNGDNYVHEALDSVLAQTFQDFEIVISDNGSTDRTEAICREYAARDSRIKFFRTEVNRGASWNFRRAVELATGENFMYLAHDDKIDPVFLEKCIAVLDRQPEVMLVYPKAIEIDNQGQHLYKKEQDLAADSPKPHVRFRELIRMDHNCETLFGLTRTAIRKKTAVHDDFPDGDRVGLAELSLYGTYYRVPEYLFLHREHPVRSINIFPTRFDRMALLEPQKAHLIVFPYWREFYEYLRAIGRAPLSFWQRLACYREMLRWVRVNRRRLTGDLVHVAKRLVKQILHLQGRPSEAQ
jgi:glycosyltransferase involved in cell wall biosynthesis